MIFVFEPMTGGACRSLDDVQHLSSPPGLEHSRLSKDFIVLIVLIVLIVRDARGGIRGWFSD